MINRRKEGGAPEKYFLYLLRKKNLIVLSKNDEREVKQWRRKVKKM